MLVEWLDAAPLWVWLAIGFAVGVWCCGIYSAAARRAGHAVAAAPPQAALDDGTEAPLALPPAVKAIEGPGPSREPVFKTDLGIGPEAMPAPAVTAAEIAPLEAEIAALQDALAEKDAALVAAKAESDQTQEQAARAGADAQSQNQALINQASVATAEISRLRYECWSLDTRLRGVKAEAAKRDAELALESAAPVAPAPDPDGPEAALRYQNALLRQRLRLTAGVPGADAPDGAQLRYHNWLLARALQMALEKAQQGAVAPAVILETVLVEAEAPRPIDAGLLAELGRDVAAPVGASEPQALASAGPDDQGPSVSGHRYRAWMLSRCLSEVLASARAGAPADAAAIERVFAEVGVVEEEPAEGAAFSLPPLITSAASSGAPAALSVEAAAAETLRQRAQALESELATLTAAAAAERSELHGALADAGATARRAAEDGRRRLWRAEWARNRAEHAPAPETKIETETTADLAAAAADTASSLRRRADQAEAALRQLRADAARAAARPAPEPAPEPIVAPALARADAAIDEADALRRRLALSEGALRDLRRQAAAAPAPVSPTDMAESQVLREDAASLRSRLWTAEWRLIETRDAARREAETLTADLAAMKTALAEVETATPAAPEKAPERASESAPESAPEISAAPARAEPATEPATTPAPASKPAALTEPEVESYDVEAESADIAAVVTAPLSGVEAAALEMLEQGGVDTGPEGRPAMLLDRPDEAGQDDLKLIKGVGPRLEGLLNGLGLYHFRQLAEASPEDIAWIDATLRFRGRVIRDRWREQAAQWRDQRQAGMLAVGPEGSWTVLAAGDAPPAAPAPSDILAGAAEAAALETVETLGASPLAEPVQTPLSGAEAAALELIEAGDFTPSDDSKPKTLLDAPLNGPADDLKLIQGVGPRLETLLNGLGLFYFDQLAQLDPPEMAWLDAKLAFRGRLVRDRWLAQAQRLSQRKAERALGDEAADDAPEAAAEPAAEAAAEVSAEPVADTAPASAEPSEERLAEATSVDLARRALYASAGAAAGGAGPAPRRPVVPPSTLPPIETPKPLRMRPRNLLASPPIDGADDLKLIQGVGPKLETALNDLGVFTFDQLALLGEAEMGWLDEALTLDGKTAADDWSGQSRTLEARKTSGALVVGVEGLWTEPVSAGASPAEAPAPTAEDYAAADWTHAETDALALIDGGFVAEAANRPAGLLERPIAGAPDDLKLISGVGPKLEALLNDLGVYYYRQIANFTATDIAWLDARLRFNGRIARERWLLQAADLEKRYRGG